MSAARAPATPDRAAASAERLDERDNSARLLALLDGESSSGITIAALSERGIERPGQAIYDLRLAGYEIDQVPCQTTTGNRSCGYRLRRTIATGAAGALRSRR